MSGAPEVPVIGGHSAPSVVRRLGTQTIVVLFGNVFTLLVGWPFQILVGRILGPTSLGEFGLMDAAVSTTLEFLNLGIAQSAIRHLPAHLERQEFGSIRGLLKRGIQILLPVGLTAFALAAVAVSLSDRLWPAVAHVKTAAIVMAVMLPLSLLTSFLLQSLRGLHEIRFVVIGTSVVQLVVKIVVTLALFAVGQRLLGYAIGTVAATASVVAWLALGLVRQLRRYPATAGPLSNRPEWWSYAAVTFGAGIMTGAMVNVDRFALGFFSGASAVGVLMAARQLQQMPLMFNQMLLMVGAPMLSAAHSRNDATGRQHLYGLMTDWVVRSSLPLFLFLGIFGHALLTLYGDRFAKEGTTALWILLTGQFVNVLCGPVGNVALMSGLEKLTLRLGVIVAVVETILLVCLVPWFGLIGAATAAACATISLNLANLLIVRRRLEMKWWDPRFQRWFMPGAATAAAAVIIARFNPAPGVAALAGTLVALYGVFVAVSLLQGLHEDDKDLAQHLRDRIFPVSTTPQA